jgi:hypothetical protein
MSARARNRLMCPACGKVLSDTVDVLGIGRPQGFSAEVQVYLRNTIRQLEGLKTQLKQLLDQR